MHRRALPPMILLILVLSVLGVIPALAAPSADDLEPLPVKLPPAHFSSTPLQYENEHCDPRPWKEPEAPSVPKGTVNLSHGKPVTAGAPKPNYGKLELVTDGKVGHEEENVVELPYGPQWVQIDLGRESELYAIVLWHFYANDRVYYDVVIQVAGDAEFTKNVKTVFNNDYDNSLKLEVGKDREFVDCYMGKIVDAKGVKGRYVRLYSNGNTTDECNHYIEVQVYGKPAK